MQTPNGTGLWTPGNQTWKPKDFILPGKPGKSATQPLPNCLRKEFGRIGRNNSPPLHLSQRNTVNSHLVLDFSKACFSLGTNKLWANFYLRCLTYSMWFKLISFVWKLRRCLSWELPTPSVDLQGSCHSNTTRSLFKYFYFGMNVTNMEGFTVACINKLLMNTFKPSFYWKHHSR